MKSKWMLVLAVAVAVVVTFIYAPNVVNDGGVAIDRAIDLASQWVQRWWFI